MKGEKVYKITQKISSVAIVCFIISLILEGVNDIFKWSSLISCIGVYSGSLLKEKQKNEKISIPSGILCFGVIVWVVIRSFYPNIYVNILGQCIVYGFLANTGKVMTGKFNKALLITILASLLLNWIHLILDIDWLLLGIAILQIIVFLQFLDPILERIALDHREKKTLQNRFKRTRLDKYMYRIPAHKQRGGNSDESIYGRIWRCRRCSVGNYDYCGCSNTNRYQY